MKIRMDKKSSKLALATTIVMAIAVIIVTPTLILYTSNNQAQAYLTGFDAGNIMSDFVMSNKDTMSVDDIQSFLKSKNSCNDSDYSKYQRYTAAGYTYSWRDGHFVCMADDTFNGKSAAQIIYQAAQDYSVNPQVLIVVLQKEQSLVTDTWPNSNQYASATGFGCPDTAACDSSYSGLEKQVRSAAAFFREVLDGGWSNYPVGNNYIYYSPNKSCGGSWVNIQNKATSALYRYTPYQPNQAALNAGTGTGDSCSSYGNRNFYNYFTEWFGSTQEFEVSGAILERYNQVSWLGKPIANMVYAGNEVWWQEFESGFIIGSTRTGFWESQGSIRERWGQLGYQDGVMGFPTGPIVQVSDNSWYQNYENGTITGKEDTGYWESIGGINERWGQLGYQDGWLGYPIGPDINSTYQAYEGGFIVGSVNTGYWESSGSIRDKWASLGYQNGTMGFPSGPIQSTSDGIWMQRYQNGYIFGAGNTGFWKTTHSIYSRWRQISYIGLPISDNVNTGSVSWQEFTSGFIVGSQITGYWESKGEIRTVWATTDYQTGPLGLPTGPEQYDGSSSTWSQGYEHGIIYFRDNSGWYIQK